MEDRNAFTCQHENDVCTDLMVATPDVPSVLKGNANLHESLYRDVVDPDRLKRQHERYVRVLEENGVRVHNMLEHINPHTFGNIDLANVVFTRDPLIVTPKGIVVGRFREPVRRIESELVTEVLANMDIPAIGTIRAPGFVEGGDFFPAGDVCFIASGNRTNDCGIQQLLDGDMFGTEFVAIVKYPEDHLMKTIHLDCYFGLVGNRYAVLWSYAMEHVTVTEMRRVGGSASASARYVEVRSGIPLAEYLTGRGYEIIEVDDACQEKYGCNILDIGNNTILTQDEYVTGRLKALGYRVIFVEFDEVHKMYGGIRCASQALRRIAR